MLERIRRMIAALIEQRNQARDEREAIITTAEAERGADGDLTTEESAEFDRLTARMGELDAELAPLQAREAELVEEAERDAELAALEQRILANDADGNPREERDVRVTDEPDIYRENGEHSFLRDMWSARRSDARAAQRLAEHSEQRAGTTGSIGGPSGGLVPPQFLTDQFAPLLRAGAPLRQVVTRLTLPANGTRFEVPRQTAGTAAESQAAEGDAVQDGDNTVADLDVDLVTIAGRTTVSMQSLQRGVMGDELHTQDLAAAYVSQLGSQLIAGAGTGGTHKGTLTAVSAGNTVAYTDASPTLAEFVPKVADAIQRITSGRFLPPDIIVMHPRRWGWVTAALDSSNRPITAIEAGGQNVVASGDAAAVGVVGSILGVPVLVDPNMPTNLGTGTNEDAVIVARSSDLLLWEEGDGSPMELSIEIPSELEVTFVAYGYTAFTAERYTAGVASIEGTGLVTPSF